MKLGKKKKSYNAAHYDPTKQMGDHATHMDSLKFLNSGIFFFFLTKSYFLFMEASEHLGSHSEERAVKTKMLQEAAFAFCN